MNIIFPKKLIKKVLKGKSPNLNRPGFHLSPIDLEEKRKEVSEALNGFVVDDEDLDLLRLLAAKEEEVT